MPNETGSEGADARVPAGPVCPRCLDEVFPFVDFCPRCRTPLTSFANTGPLESALSEGWGLGEAIVTKQPRLVTLVGLLLLLTPTLLGGTAFLVSSGRSSGDEGATVGRLVAAGTLGLAGWALVHATRNYVRARRRPG